MGIGFYLSVAMLPVMITLSIIFFYKEKVNNNETKIYGLILFNSIIMTTFEIISALLFKEFFDTILYKIVAKLVLISYVSVFFLFCEYIMFVCKRKKMEFNVINIFTAIIVLLMIVTTTSYNEIEGVVAPQGLPVILTFFYSICVGIYELVLTIKNRKEIIVKKFAPLYVFLALGIINTLIIYVYPTSFMVGYIICLVIIIMNFTIENPDVKLAKELAYQKQVAEASSNKTLELLDDMSKDLKSSLTKLELFGTKKIDKNNMEELYKEISDFQQDSIKLNEKISGVLDLATIKGTTSIKENKYETYDMLDKLKQLLVTDKENVGNLKINISSDMPSVLYGDDSSVIKIVLYFYNYISSIIHDDKLLLDISSLQVGRFSRLKFKFATSDLSINNHIQEDRNTERLAFVNSDDINYQIIDNLIKTFNGKITIIEKESTTTVELSVDQRTLTEYDIISNRNENKNIEIKYHDYTGKRILIVDNNNVKIKDIKTLFKPYNVDVVSTDNQGHMCEILSRDEVFDLILIDDIIPNFEYSDYTNEIIKSKDSILNHIRLTAKYPITTIIMLNPSTKHNEQEYLDYGFNDYIIKPLNKNDLDKILKKYFDKK